MSKIIDLTGKKFGRLTVIEYAESKRNGAQWLCVCECGNKKVYNGQSLRTGHTRSCGCYAREFIKINNSTHGQAKTRLYIIWGHMNARCNNKNTQYYGERGITVYEEWKQDFTSFYNWSMENGYNDTLSIDRIDVNGNYDPDNCRWVTMKVQQRNRSNNIKVMYKGEQTNLFELSEITGINIRALYSRYYRGERGEKLVRPIERRKQSI